MIKRREAERKRALAVAAERNRKERPKKPYAALEPEDKSKLFSVKKSCFTALWKILVICKILAGIGKILVCFRSLI